MSGLILLVFGIFILFISYQALRHRRLFWGAPTFSGFRNRKSDKDSKGLALFFGIAALVSGLWFLFLAYRYFTQV